jgi:plasmid stabilization system protein ParE
MMKLLKSRLFMQQWEGFASDYQHKAGDEVAERFIIAVDNALLFVAERPNACPIYEVGYDADDIRGYHFHKWQVRGFPHIVLFHMIDAETVLVDAIYAQRMDIPVHITEDLE